LIALSRLPRRLRRAVVAALAVATAGVGALALTASAAQAYPYSNVYVSFPTWLGNCPGGGSVTGIFGANGNIWSTAGDWGDDLIYPRVNLNANNAVSAKVFCSRPLWRGGNYWGPAVSANIRPTRGGQTFWIGPFGQSHN
jgi:hypothetical protein